MYVIDSRSLHELYVNSVKVFLILKENRTLLVLCKLVCFIIIIIEFNIFPSFMCKLVVVITRFVYID